MTRRLITGVVALAMVLFGFPFGAQPALAVTTGTGTVSLTAIGSAVGENFNTLASTGTSSTLPTGWYFDESSTNANTLYTAGTGSGTAGDTYSFGSSGSTERAFGQLRSGALVTILGAGFTNNTASPITSFDITYTGEQWRAGVLNRNAADRMDFAYSTDATSITTGTFVAVPALSFSSPNILSAAGALDGNAAANRTVITGTVSGVNIAPGASFFIRWTDFDISSSDDGLAIDDFAITPRTSDAAPTVVSTTPANGATNVALNANLAITFSEPVALTDPWFTISCATSGSHAATASGGPVTFALDPATDFASAESCTVTVSAARVSDADTDDPPDHMPADHVFSFTTVAPTTFIHDIQGAAQLSPKNGQAVFNVPGIVTARRSNGFYMQDPNPDADPSTSEAIFVFTSSAPTVAVGDAVTVNASVSEFRPGGASTANLTTTELVGPTVTVLSTGNPLPATTVVGVGGRIPPTSVIEDDAAATGDVETSNVFDPASDGIDFWESLEAMRVEIHNAVATGPSNSFNEISVLADDGTGATGRTARGGIVISATDKNPEKIVLDDEILKLIGQPFPTQINVGDHFVGQLIGVIDYNFGLFMLELTGAVQAVPAGLAREVAAKPGPNQITIATFNVENLDPGDGTFATMANLIVNNLRSPDIISLEEIQDNDGEVDSGTVDATVTLTKLRDAVVAAGGPSYEWRVINPVNDQDGGAPGGNIRQVFFFRTDRGVAFIDRAGGGSTTANAVVNDGGVAELQFSPGRIDPTNPAFNSSRKPLAAEFTYNGTHFIAIANHWNSKGGDDPLWGHRQPPVLNSEVQRMQQATIVRNFVQQIFAVDPNTDVVVLGDLNDFEFSNPLMTLKSAPLNDLIETLPANERYTYVFEGNSQTLDHILVSNSLIGLASTDVVHVNSEFWDQASDHEPQVATLTLADTTAPDLVIPADILRSTGPAATSCGVVISDADLGTATATDRGGAVTITRTGVPAGNVFPVGDTFITYTATDASGNTAIAMQKVTGIDNTSPQISAPADALFHSLADVPPLSGAGAGATDNCGTPTITVTESNNGGAGSAANPLVITRTFTATDASGNTASATQTITVIDDVNPVFTSVPGALSIGTGPGATSCSRFISDAQLGFATATDNSGLVTITRSGVPAGNVFPVGTTVITFTATDGVGNTAVATQNVTVFDNTPPTIVGPANASYQLQSQVPAASPSDATATDNCGPVTITVTQSDNGGAGSPSSPLIITRTYTAIDTAGNTAVATQTITVADTTPPTITAPANVTVFTGAGATICAAQVTSAMLGTPTATDNSGHVAITGPAAGLFPLGTTIVTWTATDPSGNTASATQLVRVIDNTPPTLTAPANVTRNATATLTFISDADLGTATASDNCGLVAVTRTGVPAANLFPLGTTTITYTAVDGSTNTTTATQTVTVGHTETSLCALVRTLVTKDGIANSLCAKLSAAAASLARGNQTAHENQLEAFRHEVEAQRGKAISESNADILIALADLL